MYEYRSAGWGASWDRHSETCCRPCNTTGLTSESPQPDGSRSPSNRPYRVHLELPRRRLLVPREKQESVWETSGSFISETNEVVQLLPSFSKFATPVIAITSKAKSTLASQSTAVLNYGSIEECGHMGLAPSTSTALMLPLGDALTLVVSQMKDFEAKDFAKLHPGGSLGRRLALVDEVMRPLTECRLAKESETVREIYVRHGGRDRRAGVVLVTDNAGVLTGLFTDSDLARMLKQQRDDKFDQPIKNVMTSSPITIASGSKVVLAIETLACRNLSELPVVSLSGKAGPLAIMKIIGFANISRFRSSRE